MMRLSATERFGAVPTPVRSSGTWATRWTIVWRGVRLPTSTPFTVTEPEVQRRRPVRTWASSDWPLPATPATPRISPDRTSREIPRRAGRPRSLCARTSCMRSTTGPGANGVRSIASTTSRPTIRRARPAVVVSAIGMPAAVARPRRITLTRSAIWLTSPSLWLMKTTDAPPATMERRVRNRSAASCGARTAVGSSRMRIRAPR